jgi:hypothetical protein
MLADRNSRIYTAHNHMILGIIPLDVDGENRSWFRIAWIAESWATWATRAIPKGKLSLLKSGGRDRDRTCDLVVANDALSQLSYTPT